MIPCGTDWQNNYIQTSKYTLLSFFPVNLIEQFQRLANFYFLCLLVLQFLPTISSLTPVTTAVPLIGVLALTAIKDAYDDYVRTFFFGVSAKLHYFSKCFYETCSKDTGAIRKSTIESHMFYAMGNRPRNDGTRSRSATSSGWRTISLSQPTSSCSPPPNPMGSATLKQRN